jgi:hypothetical protein
LSPHAGTANRRAAPTLAVMIEIVRVIAPSPFLSPIASCDRHCEERRRGCLRSGANGGKALAKRALRTASMQC